jgi:nucleoside-diphosphate-sugar epimerase
MSTHKALVGGANGVIGRSVAEYLSTRPGWNVIGASRRTAQDQETLQHLSVDLLDPEDCTAKLSELHDITHLIFAAYAERATPADLVTVNVALLQNLLDAVEPSSPHLRHVTLYQGGKAYGCHLGPFKTPAREDDPRYLGVNFYYDQEDLLRTRQQRANWSWTVFRPEAVCGFAVGTPMNLSMVIAVYASISRELGLPLRFPGTPNAYTALYQVTSADILARATEWATGNDSAANEIFNVTNGDYFRWAHLWPALARYFDMPCGDPLPLRLTEQMADKESIWNRITERHGLAPIPYNQIASWGFGDAIFGTTYDNITSTIKLRRAGFPDCIDTEEMFCTLFARLRLKRIIP